MGREPIKSESEGTDSDKPLLRVDSHGAGSGPALSSTGPCDGSVKVSLQLGWPVGRLSVSPSPSRPARRELPAQKQCREVGDDQHRAGAKTVAQNLVVQALTVPVMISVIFLTRTHRGLIGRIMHIRSFKLWYIQLVEKCTMPFKLLRGFLDFCLLVLPWFGLVRPTDGVIVQPYVLRCPVVSRVFSRQFLPAPLLEILASGCVEQRLSYRFPHYTSRILVPRHPKDTKFSAPMLQNSFPECEIAFGIAVHNL